jgi:hypothetical protein
VPGGFADEPRLRQTRNPHVDIEGNPGDTMVLEADCVENRRHLPVIRVRRAARTLLIRWNAALLVCAQHRSLAVY